jgi:hypothetical protein
MPAPQHFSVTVQLARTIFGLFTQLVFCRLGSKADSWTKTDTWRQDETGTGFKGITAHSSFLAIGSHAWACISVLGCYDSASSAHDLPVRPEVLQFLI